MLSVVLAQNDAACEMCLVEFEVQIVTAFQTAGSRVEPELAARSSQLALMELLAPT